MVLQAHCATIFVAPTSDQRLFYGAVVAYNVRQQFLNFLWKYQYLLCNYQYPMLLLVL